METKATLAVGLIIAAMAAAPVAQADMIVYQQTFSDATPKNLLTDYDFSLTGWEAGGTYSATGGKAVFSNPGNHTSGRLTDTLSTPYAYDWLNPMTLSADLSTTTTSANANYGIIMGNLAYSRNVGSALLTNGRGGGGTGWNQITGWLESENTVVMANGLSISITVRQNADNADNFDVLFKTDGVDQGIGWYTGYSKVTFGLKDPISTLGVMGGNLDAGLTNPNFTHTFDNLTLSVVPEPATFGMLGVAAIAMLLRRRIKG